MIVVKLLYPDATGLVDFHCAEAPQQGDIINIKSIGAWTVEMRFFWELRPGESVIVLRMTDASPTRQWMMRAIREIEGVLK